MSRSRGKPVAASNTVSSPEWAKGAVLVGLVFAVYWQVLHAGFIWDDAEHLTENPVIVGPLGFREIWTTAKAFYFPLVLTTFWVLHKFIGLAPLPYHLLNIAFHAASAVMLWRLLRLLDVRGAWFGAAFWALHPVMVKTVAWVTEMKNTQSTFFFLVSIYVFIRADWGKKRSSYLLSLLLFLCALTSKSATVMLPAVLALCIWWKRGRLEFADAIRLVPFFAISAIGSGWTIWEQKFHSGAFGTEWSQSPVDRLIVAGCDVWFYLGKLIWPAYQSLIYPRWTIDSHQVIHFVPVFTAVAGLVFLWWKRNTSLRPVLVAAVYFVLSLIPVLDFFDVYFFRYSFVSDHFQYLAAIGPLALAGALLATWEAKISPSARRLPFVLSSVFVCVLMILSWRQTADFRDGETLYRMTIQKNPACWLCYNNLGRMYLAAQRLPEAIDSFDKALSLKPDLEQAKFNVAEAHLARGDYAEAERLYQAALPLQPNNARARNNFGVSLLGQQKIREAVAQFIEASRIDPTFADAHYNLGYVLARIGHAEEAVPQFREALRLKPDYIKARNELEALGAPVP